VVGDYLLAGMAAAGLAYTAHRDHVRFCEALAIVRRGLVQLGPTVCLAIFAASLLMPVMPSETMARWIGADSGISGILIASCIGAVIPGGPVIAFPVVMVFETAGAGIPQITALLSGWSVVAFHRMVAFELPLMGSTFAARRLVASLFIPPLSGMCAFALAP
jgi:uncharacterized membrane protein YraQ (UPF0718 family)